MYITTPPAQPIEAPQAPIQPIPQPPKPHLRRLLITLSVFLVLLGIVGSGAFQFNQKSTTRPATNPVSSTQEFKLTGTEVHSVIDGKSSVLFQNLKDISDIRLGPDGKTLHFKQATKIENQYLHRCANLEEKDTPAPVEYTNPPPHSPPWDFRRIGEAHTIKGCEGRGYLLSSRYFVYLQYRSKDEVNLVYEDLIEKKKNQLQLSPTLLGFTDPKVDLAQIIFTPGIKGKDDFTYYYPHQDVETRENLVLSFGQLIIAIDPLTNTFIGGKAFGSGESIDEYGISGSSYTFINEKSLPYVLIESHLDGQDFFAAIIDITNNTFKVVKLMDLDNRPRFDFKVQHARWENTSILFNFLDVEQINIPKELLEGKDLTTMSETEIYSLSRQVEQVLSRSNQYEKVICDVNIGSHTPLCEGLKGIINYSYSHEGLLKHESAPNSEPI